MHTLVGLVVVVEDNVVFTQQHFFGNMGEHFESFSRTKPRSFTEPLTTFEILTILCDLVEMGPSTWEAGGWNNQHNYVSLACLVSNLKP